jgi:hypothetical protein
MFAGIVARLNSWLNHKPQHGVSPGLQLRINRLRQSVRRGGRGSDLAAAELRGITTTIMELGR